MNSYETQDYLFDIINKVMFTLLIVSYVGVWNLAPGYLEMLRTIIQIYISLFLIIRFNPYVKRANFSELDRKVAYSAGLFVFASTIIARYVTYAITKNSNLKKKDADVLAQTVL